MKDVTIRIWNGATVVQLISVGPTGSTSRGAVGGAQCSAKADIELDPWLGLVVDHRSEFPGPVSTKRED